MIQEKSPYYPVLESELAKRGIKKKDIADLLGIKDRSLSKKMSGETDFWLTEALAISTVISGIPLEQLFSHSN